MDELRQYHPSLKISRVKELPKGDFVAIGDSVQDIIILQNESKIKASLGKSVKISKVQTKSLATKGVPTDIMDIDFKEFLDLNKISYVKAECLKSKKDGRVLPTFRLEISNPTEAEALISQNLVCQVNSIVYEVEEFRSRSATTARILVTQLKTVGQSKKCLICGENHTHKGCPNRE